MAFAGSPDTPVIAFTCKKKPWIGTNEVAHAVARRNPWVTFMIRRTRVERPPIVKLMPDRRAVSRPAPVRFEAAGERRRPLLPRGIDRCPRKDFDAEARTGVLDRLDRTTPPLGSSIEIGDPS